YAFSRIDQDNGEIGGGGAGHHVAGILFMPRRIGDDEFPLVGGEEAIGDVDGDTLLALRLQPVEEEGVVNIAILRADALALGGQRRKLVLEKQFRIPEEPADEGALAIIDAAAGDEAQQVLLLLRLEIGVDLVCGLCGQLVHHKYPYCFFVSLDPAWSLSLRRPCRSEVRGTRISWRRSGRVAARDSIAAVSG